MQITINIAGGSSTSTQPPAISDQSPDSLPVDAGASPAQENGDYTESNLETPDRAQALDAGAPPASLLEEVEATLQAKDHTTEHAEASTDTDGDGDGDGDGVSAGAAPA